MGHAYSIATNMAGGRPALSNEMFDYRGFDYKGIDVKIVPGTRFQFQRALKLPLKTDAPITDREKIHGSPRHVIGNYPSLMPVFEGYGGIEIYNLNIKRPGEAFYRVPKMLLEADPRMGALLKKIADHQFSISPFAKHKTANITIRKLPTNPRFEQAGDDWHPDLNNAPDDKAQLRKYGMSEFDIKMMSLGGSIFQCASYGISNEAPTIYQTEESPYPAAEITDNEIKIINIPPHEQADPYDLILGNATMIHKAAKFTGKEKSAHREAIFVFHCIPKSFEQKILAVQNTYDLRSYGDGYILHR
jgi:hypothetical protein